MYIHIKRVQKWQKNKTKTNKQNKQTNKKKHQEVYEAHPTYSINQSNHNKKYLDVFVKHKCPQEW
jgi:endonuclease IV